MGPGGSVAGRFEILAVAGSGGMGTVFRARDVTDGSIVAVKLLHDRSQEVEGRFAREARVLASLRHPAIVRYLAHGDAPGEGRFLAMEWLEGETLAARLARGALTVAEAVAMAARLADALGTAHAGGVVHRDVKPENVLLAGGDLGRAKLVDFGIARGRDLTSARTRTGAILGSPGYMAPEQARGDRDVDARADVFALGAVLFECVTGRPAFGGDSVVAILARILLEDAPRLRDVAPAAPHRLDDLLARMLAKDPAARPRDGAAVAVELGAVGAADELAAVAPSARVRALTSQEQHILSVIVAPASERAASPLEDTLDAAAATGTTDVEGIRVAMAPFGAELAAMIDGSVVVYVLGSEAATDQTSRAAHAALALRDRLGDAAVGLATGRGLFAAGGVVGEVVDRASRLVAKGPGVHLDETTARLLDGRFLVQGADDPILVEAYESPDQIRTLLGRRTPCVGREREIAKLAEHLDECREEGIARVVLVTGPPGIGKSRLRSELARVAAMRGVAPWMGLCDPLRATSPFGLLASLVAGVVGLSEGMELEARRAKLAARLAERIEGDPLTLATFFLGELCGAPAVSGDDRLRAARREPALMEEQIRRAWLALVEAEAARAPVLIVLEDIQWADPQSLRFVDLALRDVADRPFLVVAFARPEVHDTFPRLFRDRDLHEVTLRELGKRASERLVREVLGADVGAATVERLVARANGNAFFLEELIRAEAEGRGDALPETVLAMAQVRIERLPAEARQLLRAGSVLGEVFWEGAVATLLGRAGDRQEIERWLADLDRREVLVSRRDSRFAGDREHAFRHALVRDAAYATLTDGDRALGHRLAAEWLEAHGEAEAAVLAAHLDRGNDAPRASRAHERAAEQALRRSDFQQAVAHVDRALALGAAGDRLAGLRLVRGRALACASRWAEARADLGAALGATPEDALERRAEILMHLAGACFWSMDIEGARSHGLSAIELADALGNGEIAAGAMGYLSSVTSAGGDPQGAIVWAERGEARAGGAYVASLTSASQFAYWLADLPRARSQASRHVEQARAVGDVFGMMLALPALGLALGASGRYAEAIAALEEARRVGARHGVERLAARATAMLGGLHMDLFDLDGALAFAEEAIAAGRALSFPPPLVSASIDALFIHARRGDAGAANALLPSVAEAVGKGAGWHGWIWSLRFAAAKAELALLEGHGEDALRECAPLLAQDPRRYRVKYHALGLELTARARDARGERDAAREILDGAIAIVERYDDPLMRFRVVAARLALGDDGGLRAEGLRLAETIASAIPEGALLAAFARAAPVVRLRG